jgi:hypothetical protein
MASKSAKPPVTQRSFASVWTELDYLCTKIRYWIYTRHQRVQARRYIDRLERVLNDLPENDLAIIRAEGWSLLCELKGNLDDAIAHREREIHLIERLHKEARLPRYDESSRAYLLRGRTDGDLKERRAILEGLKKQQVRRFGKLTRKAQ